MALGRVIRELCLEFDYSQEAFADAAGVDCGSNLALMNLLKLAKTLNLSVSY